MRSCRWDRVIGSKRRALVVGPWVLVALLGGGWSMPVEPTPTIPVPEASTPPPVGEGDGAEGAVPAPPPLPGFTGGGRVAGNAAITRLESGWEVPVLITGIRARAAARASAAEARAVAERVARDAAFVNADAAIAADLADAARRRADRARERVAIAAAELAAAIDRLRRAGAAAYVGADGLTALAIDSIVGDEDAIRSRAARLYADAGLQTLEARRADAVDRLVAAGVYRTRLQAEAVAAVAEAQRLRSAADRALADAAVADAFARTLEGRAASASVRGSLPELAAVAGVDRLAFPFAGPYEFWDSWGACRDACARRHQGADIIGPAGVPLVAVEDGVVRFGRNRLGGLTVWLTGVSGNRYYYAHLGAWADDLTDGSPVTAGQVIGFNGDTGNARSSVPHLHFEVHPPGMGAVNPYPFLRALAEADQAARAAGVRPTPPPAPPG